MNHEDVRPRQHRRRNYDRKEWDAADIPNRCLSAATACLYGLAEAAILAAGYAPAIGFLHRGKPQSFVYDIADIYKFDTVVPAAFRTAARIAKGQGNGSAPSVRSASPAATCFARRSAGKAYSGDRGDLALERARAAGRGAGRCGPGDPERRGVWR